MYELRAKSTKETDLLMYGGISEWGKVRAEDFIRNLSDAKSKGYEKINLKINSPGGAIIEGIAIISQMLTQEIFITGTVEGMACSMMAVVLQKCHRRKMVKGTMLMVHQGAGGVFGSANYIRSYADLMDSMNKILADIYASTTKKKAEWILENWMAEGKDTWFTAEQALKEGLIDEIVDGKVKPLEKEQASLLEMAAHYSQFTDTNESEMNREQLIKFFGLKADATEAEIQAALNAMKAKADAAPVADPKKDKDDAPATDKTKVIDGVVALAKERGATDEVIAKIKTVAAVDVDAAMLLIPASSEKKTDDPTKPVATINDLIASLKGSNGGGGENRANWGFDEWEKDPKAFGEMITKEPEKYQKLFEAKFGYKPSLDELKGVRF